MAHLAIVGGVGWIAYRSLAGKEAREAARTAVEPPAAVIAIELPTVSDGSLVSDREAVPEGTAPSAFGGATVARIDTGVRLITQKEMNDPDARELLHPDLTKWLK